MKDQVQGLHSLQLPATFISSDVPLGERRQRYDLLEQGTWKFIYMAPERFDPNVIRDTSEYDRLIRFRPNYLVIDGRTPSRSTATGSGRSTRNSQGFANLSARPQYLPSPPRRVRRCSSVCANPWAFPMPPSSSRIRTERT